MNKALSAPIELNAEVANVVSFFFLYSFLVYLYLALFRGFQHRLQIIQAIANFEISLTITTFLQ